MSRPLFTLLVATSNKGKLVELRRLLGDLPVELVSLATALPGRPQAVEDGVTLEENAWIKGRAAASAAMLVTIAEDSGLEVDALGGRPGVRSARFASEGATDAENNAALLSALAEVDDDQRTARFRCAMVLIDPFAEGASREELTVGACEGRITREPKGAGGFGYDPLFFVTEKGRTMAELDEDEKGAVSHRGRAAWAMRPALEALIARRLAATATIAGG